MVFWSKSSNFEPQLQHKMSDDPAKKGYLLVVFTADDPVRMIPLIEDIEAKLPDYELAVCRAGAAADPIPTGSLPYQRDSQHF